MEADRYKIVFRGKLQAGKSLEEVKQNMARVFKLGPDAIDKLFSGKSVVMKKNLDRQQALKFKTAIQKAGAECGVLEDGPSSAPQKTSKGQAVEPGKKAPIPARHKKIPAKPAVKTQETGKQPVAPGDPAAQLGMEPDVSDKPWAGVHAEARARLEASKNKAANNVAPILDLYRDECSGPYCFLAPDIPEETFNSLSAKWDKVSLSDVLALIEIANTSGESYGMVLTGDKIYVRSSTSNIKMISFNEAEAFRLTKSKEQWVLIHDVFALFKNFPSAVQDQLASFITLCRQIAAFDPKEEDALDADKIIADKARFDSHPAIIIKDEETRIEALRGYRFNPSAFDEKLGESVVGSSEATEVIKYLKKNVIPERASVYRPSGTTTGTSVLLMIPAMILGAVGGIGFMVACELLMIHVIAPILLKLAPYAGLLIGLLGLLGTIVYYLLIITGGSGVIAGKVVHWIVRLGGNRSVGLGTFAGAGGGFVCALAYYLYYLFSDDSTSGIFVYGFPVLGFMITFIAGMIAHDSVKEDKFCEVKGVFLNKHKSSALNIHAIPAFYDALRKGDYKALMNLPKQDSLNNPYFTFSLFLRSNPYEFGVGYLEASFDVTVKYKAKESDEGETSKTEKWRFLSLAYDSKEIARIGRTIKMIH